MDNLRASANRSEFRSRFLTEYKNISGIGAGAFGTVYKCNPCNAEMNVVVAVKLIEISEILTEKAKREVNLLQKVECENIVKITDHWIETPPSKYKSYPERMALRDSTVEVMFIETEFCDLKSLEDWINVPGIIKEQDVKIIMFQIATGVEYLHNVANIIHRDLKPANIFLCSKLASTLHPNSVLVKIGDFGISRESKTTMTDNIGTFGYKSPEMMIKHYKKQVDLYSFGIIFCEMMIKAPSSNYNNLIDRAEALATALINEEEKFEISCCRNFLSHCEEEIELIKRMTEIPSKDDMTASAVVQNILYMYPNVRTEFIEVPDMEKLIKATEGEYRLYGHNTSPIEFDVEIVLAKKIEFLTKLNLNYVSVNAAELIRCLEQCKNIQSIDLKIINEGDEIFPPVSLPNLTRFHYRQLHGPTGGFENVYPYLTEERVKSLLFFRPLNQLWTKKMNVKVVVNYHTVLETQCEDSGSKIYLTANNGTKYIYENLQCFENVNSVYLFDHCGTTDIRFDATKIPSKDSLATLAVELPIWNQLNEDINHFKNLRELYLSSYSQKYANAGLNYRRTIVLGELPVTIQILTFDDLVVHAQLSKKNKLKLDSLSLINCKFFNDEPLDNLDSSQFLVNELNIIADGTGIEIYRPNWNLMKFLLQTNCEKIYFSSFDWHADSDFKEGGKAYLKECGIPNNTLRFLKRLKNSEIEWKVVEVAEHNKIRRELTHVDKFAIIVANDEFRRTEETGLASSSYGCSWIEPFNGFDHLDGFYQNGRTDVTDYSPCKPFPNKPNVEKAHLKFVEIQATCFPFNNLMGCGKLKSLTLENVKLIKNFVGSIDLPQLKEFFCMSTENLPSISAIPKFYSEDKMCASLFFNKNSFHNLWKKDVNTLIGVDNEIILELNHYKGLIRIQFCNYASKIIAVSGMLEHPQENCKSLVIYYCSGLSEMQHIPNMTLTYLNLSIVDVNLTAILDSHSFPCLQSIFYEPMKPGAILDLCKIPPTVKKVGLAQLELNISAEYTCDSLAINNCKLTSDFKANVQNFLRVRKFVIVGGYRFVRDWKILQPLMEANICDVIYIKFIEWDQVSRNKIVSEKLISWGLTTDHYLFELIRCNGLFSVTRSYTWSQNTRNIDKEIDELTGCDITPKRIYQNI